MDGYDTYCDRIEGDYLADDVASERARMERNAPRCKGCGERAEVKFYRGTGLDYVRCTCTDTVVW